ncbi:hypothetical protein DRQ25_18500 [Candidatus Fermentibacteria bacterium]|nr:MAG: hypothetical protein DRQ25_18500 [Candidatus Fermentibacteria bacterium]
MAETVDSIFTPSPEATVSPLVDTILEAEGGYQNSPTDPGNFNSQGELVGTNHGIAAPTYEKVIGHPPTTQEMQSMTQDEARQIHTTSLVAQKVNEVEPETQEMVANMRTMTSGKGVDKVLKAAGPNATKQEIWTEYEKYLKSLKQPELLPDGTPNPIAGQPLWDTYGKGWTNRYQKLL